MSKPDELSAHHMSSRSGFIHERCHAQWSELIGVSWCARASGLPAHSIHKSFYIMSIKNNSCLHRRPNLTHLWRQVHKDPANMLKRG